VVECTALEMRSTRKGTVGSNPTLSAILHPDGLRGGYSCERAPCSRLRVTRQTVHSNSYAETLQFPPAAFSIILIPEVLANVATNV
jgi:hypothetical protein